MSKIKLKHSSGNSMSIGAPATNPASDLELKLPATVGSAGQVVKNSGTAGTLEYGYATEVDQWRLTTNFQGAVEPLANNLERNDNNFTKIGDGMSVSSGYWTFPSTGIWRIEFVRDGYVNGNDREFRVLIYRSTDGSNYAALTENASNIRDFNTNGHGQVVSQAIFDVTNTSTHKVYFRCLGDNANTYTIGRTSENQTYMTFTRLGDT